MSEFSEKLEKWGKEVAKECHNYAIENDGLDFYVFQSPKPTKEKPDLLILGLNPGGGKKYKEQLGKRLEEGKGDRETLDDLCQDYHLYVYTPKNRIKIAGTLSKIFSRNILKSILEESVAINRYYFNTKDGKMLMQEDKKILEFCKEKTDEVIALIKPKCILTLGSDNPLKANEEILKGLLWKGEYEGIPVYRIKHPSCYGNNKWSEKDCGLVGRVLEKIFEKGNDVEDFTSLVENQKEYFNITNRVTKALTDYKDNLTQYFSSDDVNRFSFANDILQITLHNDIEPYIAIRHKDYTDKRKYKENEETYQYEKNFEDILRKHNFEIRTDNQVWLGKKMISSYVSDDVITDSTIDLIVSDIIKVVTLCNEFVSQDKK